MLRSRWFLLSSLMLSACDISPGASSPALDEALGHAESALCSGASVTSLTFQGASSYGGELGAVGNWTVASANGIRLEFYLDGRPLASSELPATERPPTPDTWYHSSTGVACGSHTFQVRAWPMVIDSAGSRTTCLAQGPKIISMPLSQSCPSASINCRRISNQQVSCTGSASGGTGGVTPLWHQQNWVPALDWYEIMPWYDGSWSHVFSCESPLYASIDDGRVQVEFKVRDGSGMESVANSQLFYCLEYSIDQPF
jgi:hypothetical protein